MLLIEYTNQFKRDLKLAKKRRKNLALLQKVMDNIVNEHALDARYKDHLLGNNWAGCRELHIQPDWLLIYEIIPERNTVVFIRTGTHSDLFK
jgi:mRNA interferase YafQ